MMPHEWNEIVVVGVVAGPRQPASNSAVDAGHKVPFELAHEYLRYFFPSPTCTQSQSLCTFHNPLLSLPLSRHSSRTFIPSNIKTMYFPSIHNSFCFLFSFSSVFRFLFFSFSVRVLPRNDNDRLARCSEKTASVHKSKYDFLLEQERRRMARNSELLHMLENIDGDGVTATRTERLELLKVSFAFAVDGRW